MLMAMTPCISQRHMWERVIHFDIWFMDHLAVVENISVVPLHRLIMATWSTDLIITGDLLARFGVF